MKGDSDDLWDEFKRWVLGWIQIIAMILVGSILYFMFLDRNASIPAKMCLESNDQSVDR